MQVEECSKGLVEQMENKKHQESDFALNKTREERQTCNFYCLCTNDVSLY